MNLKHYIRTLQISTCIACIIVVLFYQFIQLFIADEHVTLNKYISTTTDFFCEMNPYRESRKDQLGSLLRCHFFNRACTMHYAMRSRRRQTEKLETGRYLAFMRQRLADIAGKGLIYRRTHLYCAAAV